MSIAIAARFARRELRGGLRGFRIFLACLALGVAAIAAVGSVRVAIETGLAREGAAILGGDAELELTYRFASDDERQWMTDNAIAVSEIVDFRSMAVVGAGDQTERGLTQIKAIDNLYPLIGSVALSPEMSLADALMPRDGLPGAVMERVLILGDSTGPIEAKELPSQSDGPSDEGRVLLSGSLATLPLREARELFEREYLLTQINRFGGNISRTASFVGMERSALHRKLKSLGVVTSAKSGVRVAHVDEEAEVD